MSKVLFVDDRLSEIVRQWEDSGCGNNHELLPLVPFQSMEQVQEMVESLKPDAIVVGYGLGKPDIHGTDVVKFLRDCGYHGLVITNSGGGNSEFVREGVKTDGQADRNPQKLKLVFETK